MCLCFNGDSWEPGTHCHEVQVFLICKGSEQALPFLRGEADQQVNGGYLPLLYIKQVSSCEQSHDRTKINLLCLEVCEECLVEMRELEEDGAGASDPHSLD